MEHDFIEVIKSCLSISSKRNAIPVIMLQKIQKCSMLSRCSRSKLDNPIGFIKIDYSVIMS